MPSTSRLINMENETTGKITQKPKTLREFFTSRVFWKPFLGTILGGLAGFLYYYFIGCKSGTCAITSNPVNSIIMGSLMGFFMTFGSDSKN